MKAGVQQEHATYNVRLGDSMHTKSEPTYIARISAGSWETVSGVAEYYFCRVVGGVLNHGTYIPHGHLTY